MNRCDCIRSWSF